MEKLPFQPEEGKSVGGFKSFIRHCLKHPEFFMIDAVILGFGLYTITKFVTGEPMQGPSIVITGGAAGGLLGVRSYLTSHLYKN